MFNVVQLIAHGGSVRFDDVTEDEYPLIPGALETMRAMCEATYELKAMSSRVLDRLHGVCSELHQEQKSSVQQSTLVSFTGVNFRFCRLLLDIKKQELRLARLIASRAIARKLLGFHDELERFSELMHTTEANTVAVTWRKQWEED